MVLILVFKRIVALVSIVGLVRGPQLHQGVIVQLIFPPLTLMVG